MHVSSSMLAEPKCVVVADGGDTEALAIACILCHMVIRCILMEAFFVFLILHVSHLTHI